MLTSHTPAPLTSTPSPRPSAALARFVATHDHAYTVHPDGTVTIWILDLPYGYPEGWQGPCEATPYHVRTTGEAREALGY
jgi:hypothetical protein